MQQKDFVALVLLFAGAAGGILVTSISKSVRTVFFFLMVSLSVVTEFIDVNFVSRDWYRGTTRGFEVSLVDVLSISVLVSSFLFPKRGDKRFFWPASLGWMILFFLFTAFCVAVADPKLYGLFELSKMIRGMIIFVATALFVRDERRLKVLILALASAAIYEGLLALMQRYVYGDHRVYGTVDDSNSLSMFFCMTAPVFAAAVAARFPKYVKALCGLAVAMACVGVILTISRAGVVAIGLVLFATMLATAEFRLTAKKLAVMMVVFVVAGGLAAKSWRTLATRFQSSTLEDEYENKHTMGRGYYIRIAAAIAEDRWFGVGPNNWSYWVSNKYGPRFGWHFVPYHGTDKMPSDEVPIGTNLDEAQAAPAHSLGALTAGEMGYAGLVLFGLLWLRWFQIGAVFLRRRTPDPLQRMGVGFFFGTCGIFFQSLTEWVYHQTPIYYTFHLILGALASLYYLRQQRRRQEKAQEQFEDEPSPRLVPAYVETV